jgi:imidazolonepropionase-like amidohydrolase
MNGAMIARLVVGTIALFSGGSMKAQTCSRGQEVVFEGAHVITMDGASVLRAQNVVIREGRIVSIGTTPVGAGSCRIDARGKYLLPGLADMHAHMTEADLPVFLANGVTLVRELNGSPVHLAMRAKLAKGELTGPRLVVTSPLLTGKKLQFRHRLITSAEDAFAAAHEAKDAGYEFLKIYDDLTLDMYEAFVQAGKTLGLRLDGHVPAAVGLERVLAAGQSIQHMDKIAFAIGGHSIDTSKVTKARALFTGKNVWVTPTLASLHALSRAGSDEYRARLGRPEMAYVDADLMGWWKSLSTGQSRAAGPSAYEKGLDALTKAVRESGARMLIGTDASNPLMVAGYSVHDEMETLVASAGFSTLDVLMAATRNAAEFLGDSAGGRVRVGARGELLLVDDSPFETLATLRNPVGVMTGGQWLDRATLASNLKKAVR